MIRGLAIITAIAVALGVAPTAAQRICDTGVMRCQQMVFGSSGPPPAACGSGVINLSTGCTLGVLP